MVKLGFDRWREGRWIRVGREGLGGIGEKAREGEGAGGGRGKHEERRTKKEEMYFYEATTAKAEAIDAVGRPFVDLDEAGMGAETDMVRSIC